jgi:CheY-like chemotaxis protein
MKRILIVEDVELNLDLLEQLLEDKYEIISADNGEDGLAMADSEKPDLILMDMSLPKMDGWEATRRIKANPDLQDIPVVALTAHAMTGDREKAVEAGCDDFLTKPIKKQLLFDTLKSFLGDG